MARIETRRTVLLPAGIFYWNGTSSPARGGTPFLVARWFGALSCGRGALAALHRGVGWATGRPVENHRGAESTLHVFPCDSSQRRKSFILTRCSTAGCLTRTFNSVTPSPISSTQMSPVQDSQRLRHRLVQRLRGVPCWSCYARPGDHRNRADGNRSHRRRYPQVRAHHCLVRIASRRSPLRPASVHRPARQAPVANLLEPPGHEIGEHLCTQHLCI